MYYQGREGFKWWTGVVEDRNDPLFLNRVRVRIYGAHSYQKDLIATPDLPWSQVMMPTTSPSLSGLGTTTHGLVEGSTVMGFYRDTEFEQDPVVMGSFIGAPKDFSRIDETIDENRNRNFTQISRKASEGFNDPRLATATDYELDNNPDGKSSKHINRNYGLTLALDKSPRAMGGSTAESYPRESYTVDGSPDVNKLALGDSTFYPVIKEHSPEPKRSTYVKPIYPFNHVHETESGHVIELDDTPEYERLHAYHRTGTRIEIDKDGNYVEKIVKDKYTVILENDTIKVEGIVDIEIGDSSLSSVMGALGGIAGVADIVGTDLLGDISTDILDKLPDGITTITDKVTEVLDGKLNIGSSKLSEIVEDVDGFEGGESGIAAAVSKVKDAIGTAEGWTDEASTLLTETLSNAEGTVDSTVATAKKEISKLLGDKLGSETSTALESVLGSASDSVDSAVSAVTDKVTSALTDTLGAEAAAVVGDQVTAALGGALSGAVGGVLGAGGNRVTITVGGSAFVKVNGNATVLAPMGTTSVTSLNTVVNSLATTTLNAGAITNITSPTINSTGIWNHTGPMSILGPVRALGPMVVTTSIQSPLITSLAATLGTHQHTIVGTPANAVVTGPLPPTG